MKRKVNLVGQNTLTVSLPSKWVEEYNIKKGDEIDIEESNDGLIITKEFKNNEKIIKLDFSKLENRHMKWAIQVSYKEGYDNLEISFNDPDTINIIEQEIRNCPGFEVVEQNEDGCVIKNIAKDLRDEFDSAVRRNFLNSINMIELCVKKIKINQLKELKELIKYEEINNKLCSFCERMVNINKTLGRKNVFAYVIIWQIEKIIDEFKYICEYFSKEENSKVKISKDIIEIFEDVNKLFRMYYELYYSFKLDKQVEITKFSKSIKSRSQELMEKGKGKETMLLYYLDRANDKIVECLPSTFALNSELFEIK